MPTAVYPICTIRPFSKDGLAGFDLEYLLPDGTVAKAKLRNDRPSWSLITHVRPDQDSTITIGAHNHDLLPTRTLDYEIFGVQLPLKQEKP